MRQHRPFTFKRLSCAALVALGVASSPAWASADLSVNDTSGPGGRASVFLQFVVTRGGDTGFPVSVDYHTVDGSAQAGRDYTATSGTLTFAAGQTSRVVNVPLLGKPVVRPRSFTLELDHAVASASGAVSFSGAGNAAIGANTESAAIADFNRDGKPDVALVSFADSAIHLLRNDTATGSATAGFTAIGVLRGPSPGRPNTVDLNRDGAPDLIVPQRGGQRVDVYMNTTPTASPTISFATSSVSLAKVGTSVYSAEFADFDGDGIVDVALANPGSPNVPGTNRTIVLRNTTPAGSSTPVLTVAATSLGSPTPDAYSYVLRALDVNGDGKPDLAVGNLVSADVSILINTTPDGGPISFAAPVAFSLPGGVTGLDTADIDGDGRPDLVSANNDASQTGTTFSVLLNRTTKGSSTPAFSVSSFDGGAPYGVAFKDVNGDGKPDLLIANLFADSQANGAIDVYLNQTAAGATKPSFTKVFSAFVGDEPHFVAVADFNGDGLPDFVTADFAVSALAGFEFGQKPVANPQAKIVDGSGTATLTSRRGN